MKTPACARLLALSFVVVALCSCSDSRPRCDQSAETDVSILTAPAPMDDAAPSDTPRYSLQDAAAKGLVQYEVRGNGGSSGESLVIGIRRTSAMRIDVYILPGTIFSPGNREAQRMVAWRVVGAVTQTDQNISPVTSMYLPDLDERLFVIEAYCLDFQLDNPQITDVFTTQLVTESSPILDSLDLRAAQIIVEGKKRELTIPGLQAAIWMDHEQVAKEKIPEKFGATAKELDDAFSLLQSLPLPKKLGAGRQTVRCK